MAVDLNVTTLELNITPMENITRGHPDWPEWKHQMAASIPYLTTALLVCIMLATGCCVTLQDLWNHLKQPVSMIIGAGSQFVLLPLASFGLAHALQLPDAPALGFLITACSPGGSTSNIFTFYLDGDVSLSICMTVTATVLALGMMPLNLFIYSRSWTSESVRIPYVKLVITLASILAPVIVGMLIHWKLERLSRIITKVGSLLGMCLIVLFLVFQVVMFPHVFTSWWQVWVAAVLFPVIGLFLGYMFAFACRRSAVHCKTIAMETGIQNLGVTFTVISLSYQGVFAAEASVIPILIGFSVNLTAMCVIVSYRVFLVVQRKPEIKEDPKIDEKASENLILESQIL